MADLVPTDLPFIGRQRELARLADLCERTRAPQNQRNANYVQPNPPVIVLVGGAPGTGKSRLVSHWHAGQSRAPRLYRLHAGPGPLVALEIFRELLLSLAPGGEAGLRARLEDKLHDLGDVLANNWRALPGATSPHTLRAALPALLDLATPVASLPIATAEWPGAVLDRIVRGVRGVVEALAFDAARDGLSTAIVIEDAEYMSAESAAVLAQLAQAIATPFPTMLVLTTPDPDRFLKTDRLGAQPELIELAPLTGEELRAFVEGALRGIAPAKAWLETLQVITGSNRLAVELQLKLAIERHEIVPGGKGKWRFADGIAAGSGVTLPLEDLAARAMSSLGGDVQRTLAAIASGAAAADVLLVKAVLTELGGRPAQLREHCKLLANLGYLDAAPEGARTLSFRNPVFRAAAERLVPADERRLVHRAAVQALELWAGGEPGRINPVTGWHAKRAEDYGTAAQAFAGAIDCSLASGCAQSALQYANEGRMLLGVLPSSAGTAGLAKQLTVAIGRSAHKAEDEAEARDTLRFLRNEPRLPGHPDRNAAALLDLAEAELESGDQKAVPAILASVEGLRLTPAPRARLARLKAEFAISIGNAAEAQRALTAARASYGEAGDAQGVARCTQLEAGLAERAGDIRTAATLLEGALQLLEDKDEPGACAQLALALGDLRRGTGDFAGAAKAYATAARHAAQTGGGTPLLDALLAQGESELLVDASPQTEKLLAAACSIAQSRMQAGLEARARIALGRCHRVNGHTDEAAVHYRKGVELGGGLDKAPPALLAEYAQVLLRAGEVGEAEPLVAQALESAAGRDDDGAIAIAKLAEAELAVARDDLDSAHRALVAAREHGARLTPAGVWCAADFDAAYGAFLIEHGTTLREAGIVKEPKAKARQLLPDALEDYQHQVESGLGLARAKLERVQQLVARL